LSHSADTYAHHFEPRSIYFWLHLSPGITVSTANHLLVDRLALRSLIDRNINSFAAVAETPL
jgi:hypothetical protein